MVYAFWQSQNALTLAIINLFQLIKNIFSADLIADCNAARSFFVEASLRYEEARFIV